MTGFEIVPIGVVRSPRADLVDDQWGPVEAVITLHPDQLTPDAVAGLAEFSHVEIVFVFDRVAPEAVHRGARHPRGNPHWPLVGVLAQRVKDRPNRLGVSRCVSGDGGGQRVQL